MCNRSIPLHRRDTVTVSCGVRKQCATINYCLDWVGTASLRLLSDSTSPCKTELINHLIRYEIEYITRYPLRQVIPVAISSSVWYRTQSNESRQQPRYPRDNSLLRWYNRTTSYTSTRTMSSTGEQSEIEQASNSAVSTQQDVGEVALSNYLCLLNLKSIRR